MKVQHYYAGICKYEEKASQSISKKIAIAPTSEGDIDAIIFLPASWLAAT
jgi:hypothetical protein